MKRHDGGRRTLRIAIVAGEESGDRLGADLMSAIRQIHPDVEFIGVAGDHMKGQGIVSIFPMSDVAVMGFSAVIARLPLVLRRIRETVRSLLQSEPEILVIIDSPGFTHSVAQRIAKKRPELPIIDYVSPSVWAWKSWRAKKMTGFIDHVMALLPFEPDVHKRLGGPPCTYVGHPLVEKKAVLLNTEKDRTRVGQPPVLVVLPGSRRSEIDRLLTPFRDAVTTVAQAYPNLVVLVPAVTHLKHVLEERTIDWPVRPQIVSGEADKYSAFKSADVALAASGTVTLELALAHVPMVVAYRVEWGLGKFRRFLNVPSIVLANLVIEDNVVPELIDEEGSPQALADHVLALMRAGQERDRQLSGFRLLDKKMALPDGAAPSMRAAQIVLQHINREQND